MDSIVIVSMYCTALCTCPCYRCSLETDFSLIYISYSQNDPWCCSVLDYIDMWKVRMDCLQAVIKFLSLAENLYCWCYLLPKIGLEISLIQTKLFILRNRTEHGVGMSSKKAGIAQSEWRPTDKPGAILTRVRVHSFQCRLSYGFRTTPMCNRLH